ncbi:MAG: formyltransferase family protein, partial [Arthrobacter sp.]
MRIVVLVSGTGSNLQAVIDAVQTGGLDVEIAAVGAD